MISPRFIFVIFCFPSAIFCGKKTCNFKDDKCLTDSINRIFVSFTAGMPGVPPSDPMHEKSIEICLPTIKYKLYNATLRGVSKCSMEVFRLKNSKFSATIVCPHMTLESGYEVKGHLDTTYVEGKGDAYINYGFYRFIITGDFEIRIGADGKQHLFYINYTLEETHCYGPVHYTFKNLYNGDKEKSDAFHKLINERWQSVEAAIGPPIMNAFKNIYFRNCNSYLALFSIEDVFYY